MTTPDAANPTAANPTAANTGPGAVNRLVLMAHVPSVEASLDFYAMLGFTPRSVLRAHRGRAFWAMAQSGSAEIMFAQSSGTLNPAEQAVLFYMYSEDVAGLRSHLLARGLRNGGSFSGETPKDKGPSVVFDIIPRDYMPLGELRIHDPDGYVILVGQLG